MKNNNLKPKCLCVKGKNIMVVDDHQYALLVWGQLFQQSKKSSILVSIDYHPDTNPSFWLYAYQKAMAINPDKEAVLVDRFQKKILSTLDPLNLKTIEGAMGKLRNDEHIYTAMELGYIKDYHMINCMEKHQYLRGHHYLVSENHFGSLDDHMFEDSVFSMKNLSQDNLILDIDLDYFSSLKSFDLDLNRNTVFSQLVNQAQLITIARSESYFNYLKKADCTIEECEEKLIDLLEEVLKMR
ncbi:UPF0489 family protein [Acetobacterium tundrae]|uniref:Uncharacterized protein n=1 Tax=Acetobacterium tundrae TaxID=132932 RepID=A0ABR6WMY8_9FIRM|nr:UPF0489 family protein [Acetobacterium tundrae]MBC3797806.1 hypothetical protein [Acetobacterium tundrae]